MFAMIDMAILVPVVAFFAVALGMWGVVELVSKTKTRTEERLDILKDPRAAASENVLKDGGGNTATETMTSLLEFATPTLAKPLEPKNEKDANALRDKLSQAGFRSEDAGQMFSGLKILMGLAGLALGGGVLMLTSGFSTTTLLRTVVAGGIMFYLPEIVLSFIGKFRKEKIFLGLPDALDLMVVCVEAGLGLDQAMRKVSDEMKKTNPIISYEFQVCNMQLQMGRTREHVLQELGDRNGVDDLKSLCSIIIQADKFGSSIAQALRVQSDSMRTRRRQIAEEKAAKTAVKLIFPLVMFIFPGIFVVLVGPAAITMVNEMLPAMQR